MSDSSDFLPSAPSTSTTIRPLSPPVNMPRFAFGYSPHQKRMTLAFVVALFRPFGTSKPNGCLPCREHAGSPHVQCPSPLTEWIGRTGIPLFARIKAAARSGLLPFPLTFGTVMSSVSLTISLSMFPAGGRDFSCTRLSPAALVLWSRTTNQAAQPSPGAILQHRIQGTGIRRRAIAGRQEPILVSPTGTSLWSQSQRVVRLLRASIEFSCRRLLR